MGTPLAFETTFARSNPRLAKLTLGMLLLCALGLGGIGPLSHHSAVLSMLSLVAGVVGGANFLLGLRRLNVPARDEVRIDAEGVRLGAELIPRAAIRAAYFVPQTGSASACVALIGEGEAQIGRIDVADHEQADRVLFALGRAPAQRTAPFGVVVPWNTWSARALLLTMVGGLALFTLSLPLHMIWLGVIGMAAAIAAPIYFVNATVHVGADGLLIVHRLGKRFVPWAEVESVDPYVRGVAVKTRNEVGKVGKVGEVLEIPTTSRFQLYYEYEKAAQAAFVTRAREALEAYRRGDLVDAAALLSRRGRPVDEWIRALLDRGGDFRAAPVPDDRLWQVVESATATPTARAGAAAVLARSTEEQGRARLRIAAEACASPRLRVVLDKAASGAPEDEVHAALAEVEDEAEAEARAAAG